ncbi:uncharacterized protein YALI1_E32936g [Yarrowia lipolytica]|uniref:Secreted protein n=1 Tax=Yarrowia lipolytica TaxID=4952 RepID=A0A1D8NKA0_YARLL|nr:hypothetical protein YALI1_E32936g [Yarrowia lipolytica]
MVQFRVLVLLFVVLVPKPKLALSELISQLCIASGVSVDSLFFHEHTIKLRVMHIQHESSRFHDVRALIWACKRVLQPHNVPILV